jgi:excisionase family DNA binding protein
MTPLTSQWLTASEAAEHLRVKPRTILRWAKSGLVPAHKLSGAARITWRFCAEELDSFIRGEMEK